MNNNFKYIFYKTSENIKKHFFYYFACSILFTSCTSTSYDFESENGSFKITLNKNGELTGLIDKSNGTNYLASDTVSPLLSVQVKSIMLYPESMVFNKENNDIVLSFSEDIKAIIHVEQDKDYLTFYLKSITDAESIDLIVWGPYCTTLNNSIGETVGIAQGEDFTIGLQALNPRTLGGYPWNKNDCMPQIDIFEQDDFTDMKEENKRYVLYRVEAAKPAGFGSSLQAYCRNRNTERILMNWHHEKYTAPVYEDEGIIGSGIALFGCKTGKTLETIGEIEINEGLPHPMIDDIWGKQSKSASAAYLIMGFGEDDIEKALAVTKKAGLRYLYHPGPFEYWGHFKLKEEQFPDGIKSMKNCVRKAQDAGIMLGVHTLSNFITTNDPYVTPVPDKRLAKVGTNKLTEDIDAVQTVIPVGSPDFFNQYKNNHLKTVVIGNELVRYGSVADKAPWILMDCQRGAFGTTPSEHLNGEEVSKLADHAYRVFLTNPELSIEVATNIAELYNQTGLRQISFDGLEGNRSTGMGNYGEILFTQTWYDNLSDEIKHHYIADASRTSHYFWHMFTRMNWGEPWYAGFRESQTDYRMKNQKYFKRNLMPGMLGWFNMTPQTSTEDIEWMLARSAAFNAGYAFCTGYKVLEESGQSEEILNMLGLWEKARMANAFSEDLKKQMKDIGNEFHLEALNDTGWMLTRVYSYKFRHQQKVRQPGEPLYSTFSFVNPADNQSMGFIITAVEGDIKNIALELDNHKEIILPVLLHQHEIIKYTSGDNTTIYDKNWNVLRTIKINEPDLLLSHGTHQLNYDCEFMDGNEGEVKLEIRLSGIPEPILGKSNSDR